ncbi:MAG: UbiA prenyltransferase family protein [Thermoplasmata archaeon]|nr:MAG: UbiA prenyltransferase family protein [Thermoplasmata archaeon]
MTDEAGEGRASFLRMAYDVLMVTSAQFWVVAIAPFYIGWFLETRTIWPDAQLILGMVIAGPLIAGSTLAYNAYTDVRVDIFNPRKAHLAYVTGWISPELVLGIARGMVVLGLLLSLLLGWEFTVLIAIAITLSFLYSYPKTKLKSLPGGDVLVNMVGLGIVMPLAGWASTGTSVSEFPHWYLVPIFFALGSLYIPTLVPDFQADRRAGYQTLAVFLGQRPVLWLGFSFLAVSVLTNFISGAWGYVLSPELVARAWPVYGAQVLMYGYYARDPSYSGMLATIGTQCIGHGVGVGFMFYALSGVWAL